MTRPTLSGDSDLSPLQPSPEKSPVVDSPIISNLKNGDCPKKNDPLQISFAHVSDKVSLAAVEREGSKAKFEQVFSDFGS